jgi:arabinose-5-phosphate isomerase
MDQILETFARALEIEMQALSGCLARVREDARTRDALLRAIDLIRSRLDTGGKIIVTGVGKSGKIGQKIAATLASTGSLAVFLHPTEGLHGDLGMVTSADVVLALSHTGNTDEILRLVPSIKSLGVPVIGLGGNPTSQLAQASDAWIDGRIELEACPHNLAPTSSTTLALALGDALAVSLMNLRGFDQRSFAMNHPGGSLGRRLQLKVRDVMQPAEVVPRVSPDATVETVIEEAGKRNFGAVLVVEGPVLRGIITDGDLRRALSHREKFFHLRASEIMTASPVTAHEGMMAFEALEKMENRPSQIKELPVVDASGHVRGLLRLHDLVRIF